MIEMTMTVRRQESQRILHWLIWASHWLAAPVILVFWAAQAVSYQHSTKGLVIMWLISAGLSLLINLSLAWRTWRSDENPAARRAARGLVVQLGLPLLPNIAVVIYAFMQHVQLTAYDLVVVVTNLVVIIPVVIWQRRALLGPWARSWYSVGLKAAPQLVQAVPLALVHSGLNSWVIGALVVQSALRLISAGDCYSHATDTGQSARAGLFAAWCDFGTVIILALCWLIGQRWGGGI